MSIPTSITVHKEFESLYKTFTRTKRGKQLLEIEGIYGDKLDIGKSSENYFDTKIQDTSVDMNANANEEKSPNNFQAEVTKGIQKLEGHAILHKACMKLFGVERADELLSSIWNGVHYFHDGSGVGIQQPYCVAFSTDFIMSEGRPYGQQYSTKPKRADSFIAQVVECCMDLSQEFAGAISPSDVLINYSYYANREMNNLFTLLGKLNHAPNAYKGAISVFLSSRLDPKFIDDFGSFDEMLSEIVALPEDGKTNRAYLSKVIKKLKEKVIENDMQKFVHVMNNKFRVAGQSPFVNVSIFDRPNVEKIFGEKKFPDGSNIDVAFIMYIQDIFASWFAKGDPITGFPYRFPVVTANVNVTEGKKRKVIDKGYLMRLAEIDYKKEVINKYTNEGNKIASCCRLTNDIKLIKLDSFANGGINLGSFRVVDINYPRLALDSRGDEEVYFYYLEERLEMATDLLLAHRAIIEERINQLFLKFFKPLGWLTPKRFFSTVGQIGMPESVAFMNKNVMEQDGIDFTTNVCKFSTDFVNRVSEETGIPFNVEQVPAESAAITLANKDRLFYPTKQIYRMYSNQFIPLIDDVEVIDRINVTGKFMKYLTGGSILHINLLEPAKSPEQAYEMYMKIIEAGVEHFAVNLGFGKCENGHTSVCGNKEECPICGVPIVSYLTRIVGYMVEVSSWNEVRREYEFPKRVFK